MKVLMLVAKNYEKDSRVFLTTDTLREFGHTVHVFDWKNRKKSGRLFKIFSIVIWNIRVWYKARHLPIDIVHSNDLDTLLAGFLIKVTWGCRLVYDCHEFSAYMWGTYLVSLLKLYEKLLLKSVDVVITVSKPVEDYLYSLGAKKVIQVKNVRPLVNIEYISPPRNIFTISFFGHMSDRRMFPDLVRIFGEMEGVNFIIGGFGTAFEQVEILSKKYGNVSFLGWATKKQLLDSTLKSNLVVCMTNPYFRNSRLALPIKLFESMNLGRPLLVTDSTFIAKMVKEIDCGFVVKYDETSIRKKVIYLQSHLDYCEQKGRNGFVKAKEHYNWGVEKINLLNAYKEIKGEVYDE